MRERTLREEAGPAEKLRGMTSGPLRSPRQPPATGTTQDWRHARKDRTDCKAGGGKGCVVRWLDLQSCKAKPTKTRRERAPRGAHHRFAQDRQANMRKCGLFIRSIPHDQGQRQERRALCADERWPCRNAAGRPP
eukprot:6196052-Pleurochrysis_carterae.AAC.2